jgi:hypothetical protein
MALIVIHPINDNYKKYKLNRLDDEVEEIIEARRRAVKEGLGKVYVFAGADADAGEPPMFGKMMIQD